MKIMENLVRVLVEYSEKDEIAYQGDVVLSLIEEDIISSFDEVFENDFKDDVVDFNDLGESVESYEVVEETQGEGVSIVIDNIEERYVPATMEMEEFEKALEKKLKISEKSALVFLKENSICYYKENIEEDQEEEINLKEKIQDWNDKIAERGIESTIQLSPVMESGLIITVFESESGITHKQDPVIEEIEEFVKELGDVDITENWKFDEDNEELDCWSTSFILEKDDEETNDDFDKVEDTDKFKKKIKEKMNSVANAVDDGVIKSLTFNEFEVTNDLNIDIEFEGSVEEGTEKSDVEDYLEEKNFTDKLIDSVGEVVDDYEDTFVEFAGIDISVEDTSVKITPEFKVVDDTGEETNERREIKETVARETTGIDPDDLLGNINIKEFLNNDGGRLIEFLSSKGLLRSEKKPNDYIRVDIYPGDEMGYVIFGFVFESLGFEQEEYISVKVTVLSNISDKLYNLIDKEVGIK